MNKNLLIKQNNELFNRINLLKSNNNALNLKVAKLNSEIETYKQKISYLENELNLLKTQTVNVAEPPVVQDSIPADLPKQEQESNDNNPQLSEEFLFASDIIGNIVIKAASAIENLNNSQNENKKELINLILGKTEIAKAEILNIVSSEVTFEAKKDLIISQYNDSTEYFKSILEQ